MFHALISTKIRLTILYHEKISIHQKKASHPRKTTAYNLIFQQRGGRATLFTSGSDNLSLSLSLSLSLPMVMANFSYTHKVTIFPTNASIHNQIPKFL
jgi:hypothetical protein